MLGPGEGDALRIPDGVGHPHVDWPGVVEDEGHRHPLAGLDDDLGVGNSRDRCVGGAEVVRRVGASEGETRAR